MEPSSSCLRDLINFLGSDQPFSSCVFIPQHQSLISLPAEDIRDAKCIFHQKDLKALQFTGIKPSLQIRPVSLTIWRVFTFSYCSAVRLKLQTLIWILINLLLHPPIVCLSENLGLTQGRHQTACKFLIRTLVLWFRFLKAGSFIIYKSGSRKADNGRLASTGRCWHQLLAHLSKSEVYTARHCICWQLQPPLNLTPNLGHGSNFNMRILATCGSQSHDRGSGGSTARKLKHMGSGISLSWGGSLYFTGSCQRIIKAHIVILM